MDCFKFHVFYFKTSHCSLAPLFRSEAEDCGAIVFYSRCYDIVTPQSRLEGGNNGANTAPHFFILCHLLLVVLLSPVIYLLKLVI